MPQTPQIVKRLEDKVITTMEKTDSPFLSAKEAGEILGCSADSLINSAEQNNLPFGFIHCKGKGYRRNLVIPKIALWNWLMKGANNERS